MLGLPYKTNSGNEKQLKNYLILSKSISKAKHPKKNLEL
jgi:hypothetical protein